MPWLMIINVTSIPSNNSLLVGLRETWFELSTAHKEYKEIELALSHKRSHYKEKEKHVLLYLAFG